MTDEAGPRKVKDNLEDGLDGVKRKSQIEENEPKSNEKSNRYSEQVTKAGEDFAARQFQTWFRRYNRDQGKGKVKPQIGKMIISNEKKDHLVVNSGEVEKIKTLQKDIMEYLDTKQNKTIIPEDIRNKGIVENLKNTQNIIGNYGENSFRNNNLNLSKKGEKNNIQDDGCRLFDLFKYYNGVTF